MDDNCYYRAFHLTLGDCSPCGRNDEPTSDRTKSCETIDLLKPQLGSMRAEQRYCI